MKIKQREISGLWTGILLAVGILVTFLTVIMIQPGSIFEEVKYFFRYPLCLLLNFLPVALTILILYFAIGNVFFASAAGFLVWNLLSYANLLKTEGRDDPLTPGDITLLREALNATGEYDLDLHPVFIVLIIVIALGFVILGIFFKTRRPRALYRILAVAGLVTVFVLLLVFVYPSNTLFASFPTTNEYNMTVLYNTRGFPYSFLHNFNLNTVEKPDGYSARQVESWIENEKLEFSEPGVKPNVIFVMCEAYSDLSEEDIFDYNEENDPMRDYKKVCSSERAISGHIVVSNINAGTANTEFDILTGMQTNMVSSTNTSSFRVVRREIPSLARTYASRGYGSFFIHPGHDWFYNRSNVYRYFGITDQVFVEAFDENDYKGTMISDEAFYNKFTANFESRLSKGSPLFVYGVTIQNHQAYNYGKFGDIPEKPPLKKEISDAAMESVSVYLEGVRDSSALALKLAEYTDTLDEPTVLVFYGDHRPSLGGTMETYKELGLDLGDSDDPESSIYTYETPFFIYCNESYARKVDISERFSSLDLSPEPVISDIYLGALVYELTGMQGSDSYFDYLTSARRTVPVICKQSYLLSNEKYTQAPGEDVRAVVEKLHKWLYYRLKTQKPNEF